MSKELLKKDLSNQEISVFEVGHVSPKRTIISQFGANKGQEIKGHYYELRVNRNGKLISYGERFISDKQMAERVGGRAFTPDLPVTLKGAKIEFVGLVEVPAGAKFEAHDGSEQTADKATLLFNQLTVDASLTADDMKTAIMGGIRDRVVNSIDDAKLADIMSTYGF